MSDHQARQSDDEKARKAPDKSAAETSPEMETRPRDSLGLAVQRAEQAPHLLQQTDALRLQGSVGNRAVEQLVAPQAAPAAPAGQPRLQRKIDQLVLRKESETVQRDPEEEELKTAAPVAPPATMAPAANANAAPEPEAKAAPPAPAPPAPAAPDTKLAPEAPPQTAPPVEEEEVKGG